mmetsp:Transcript_23484/g.37863  ORF Transcript_23484/g.37863 Transcript_23484/m.37863 type:complete len:426 (+) Transcript_23484:82-1359(+)
MSFIFREPTPVKPAPGTVTIKEVRGYVVGSKAAEEKAGGLADCHAQSEDHWITGARRPIATPISVYTKYKTNRKSWGIDAIGTMIVEIELSNGILGQGVSIGGEPGCFIVERHLSRFLEGQDPHNVELLWDQMYKATVNYGRKGLTIQAISAVDLAIWDCLGKLHNVPVYKLLGGKTKGVLDVYATTARPDIAKKLGFVGAKFPLPYGPADGEKGMKANVELVKKFRKEVGADFPLMIDCYMALTLEYSKELARRIAPYNVKWIEECLQPDDYKGYSELRASTNTCLVTCGEHEYTRYGFRQLLEGKCADLLQPDVTWCGGLTEARRVVALASAYDIPVIPHGSSVYSYHLQYAFPNCPMAEFLVMSPNADKIVPYFGALFTDEPLPKNGTLALPDDRPGFGVTFNRKGLDLKRPYARTVPTSKL